jgi:hypothetical protein
MSTLTTVLEAVANALNLGAFSIGFEAVPSYRRELRAADLDLPQVTVSPGKVTTARETRFGLRRVYEIHIVVQAKLGGEDTTDDLAGLVEEIEVYMAGRTLSGRFVCQSLEREQPYAVEHIDQLAVFTSVVTATITENQLVAT